MPTGRDRDDAARARSARPRDALGRPLPHGATGVPRQPEGQTRTPDQTIAEADELLAAGRPFHAHEVFEDAWKAATDVDDRRLWKGLAQLAVGLTHEARGNPRGAHTLLRRGAATISALPDDERHGVPIADVVAWAHRRADTIGQTDAVVAQPPLHRRS